MTLLVADNLSKTFFTPTPVVVLKKVSIEIKQGQSVAILGKSGEGKTTLLHILGTLEDPTSGSLFIAGINACSASKSKLRSNKIGFVFQNYNLLDDYTVLENVLLPASIAGHPTHKGSLAYLRAEELLDEIGLTPRKHFLAKLLSGGEKQRAAIARALQNDPDLILADEPSGNLDHTHSQAIYTLLLKAAKKKGKALVVVTHDKDLANLCDVQYALADGELTCICSS
jgi:lipoprotein-releasing system ATP-binding protein